ncbi:putative diacylglycerol acyltransferase, alpha/Beta hydrolase [Helianthus annuus]|nr:putative diacylglycerol acyltransferase, alpha/Beta hydrolase [Helianthus annuus]
MTLTLTHSGIPLSFLCNLNEKHRLRSRVLVRSVDNNKSRESVVISGVSSVNKKDAYVAECDVGGKKSKQDVPEELEVLWDDGFGTQTTDDGIEIAMNLIKSDGGPPRWFCPMACGKPIKNSPVLLYLPGIDGTGAGLVIHEKTLGKVYNVQCLHIPVWDRTSLEGLIHIVEEIVMIERTLSPNKPIYLLGESFGGALALCVAARNPTVDLILILANPATAYERSPLNFLPSLLEDLPEEYYGIFPYAMSPLVCDYIKMAMIKSYGRNHVESLWQMFAGFCKDLPLISESGVNVLTAIKTTYMYRRSSKHDILKDFLPISITEFKNLPVETWWYHLYIDAVIFSTMENGKIVRGLEGIPDEGPVLIVGNHMLMAFDVFPIVSEFMREKKITLHGLTHPEFFNIDVEREYYIIPLADVLRVGGSIPVSGRNFFKLLAKKSHVLLYPGGLREGLHRKGEAGKLFWPDKQEFVRMAVKFGATIIPFGGVGEDDILEVKSNTPILFTYLLIITT